MKTRVPNAARPVRRRAASPSSATLFATPTSGTASLPAKSRTPDPRAPDTCRRFVAHALSRASEASQPYHAAQRCEAYVIACARLPALTRLSNCAIVGRASAAMSRVAAESVAGSTSSAAPAESRCDLSWADAWFGHPAGFGNTLIVDGNVIPNGGRQFYSATTCPGDLSDRSQLANRRAAQRKVDMCCAW